MISTLAAEDKWSAEKVLKEVLKHGDTLKYAKFAFIGFSIAAVILFVLIIILQWNTAP